MSKKTTAGGLRAGVEPFIAQLAAPTTAPAGGSAAAATGAMAAGLAGMVASISRGKKSCLQYDSELGEAITRLAQLREELMSAIDADAESYSVVMEAYKSAKESPDGDRMILAALQEATNVPLGVAQRAVEVQQIAAGLKPITSPTMKADLATAIALGKAALEGVLAIVEVNLELIKTDTPEGQAFVSQTRKRSAELKAQVKPTTPIG